MEKILTWAIEVKPKPNASAICTDSPVRHAPHPISTNNSVPINSASSITNKFLFSVTADMPTKSLSSPKKKY